MAILLFQVPVFPCRTRTDLVCQSRTQTDRRTGSRPPLPGPPAPAPFALRVTAGRRRGCAGRRATALREAARGRLAGESAETAGIGDAVALRPSAELGFKVHSWDF